MNVQETEKLYSFLNELNDKVDKVLKRTTSAKPTRSEQIDQLANDFAKAQAEYPSIGFNRNNPFFKSKYADLDAIMYAIRPILGKYGLSFYCETSITEDERYLVYAQLLHKSGQWISSSTRIVPESADKNYNQAFAKSLTYMKRNMAMALLNVTCTEDPVDNDIEYSYPDPGFGKVNPQKGEILRSTSDPSYDTITKEQWEHLSNLLQDYPDICKEILQKMELKSLRDFPKDQFEAAVKRINKMIYDYKSVKSL
jgi:hypothetical protein